MYKVKGYMFNVTDDGQVLEFSDILVNNREEAFQLLEAAGVEHYMFVLEEVKK